ncbi:MAG: GntR family transcriptional regulator [Eubacteriales bacterium]|nr:GntR family transcriptional regulator [Eubacteriales bacterium]
MEWKIMAGRPVYLQLVEQLERCIVTGVWPAGTRVPPVRELAAEAGVNPNTMQRALQELEGRGLLQSQRTAGRIVTAGEEQTRGLRQERAEELAREFLRQMRELGCSPEQVRRILQQAQEQQEQEETRADRMPEGDAAGKS